MRDHYLWISSLVLAAVGLADSIYLTWVKFAHQAVFCPGYGGCETVNTSQYSQIAGIPIALMGAGAYLLVLVLLYLETTGQIWKENSPLLVFGISLVGVLFSAYLTYIEIAVLHAICFYCVVSAVVLSLLFILSVLRLVAHQAEINPI